MYKLESRDYNKVEKLVQSDNELSVQAVIHGIMPGEIFVNDNIHPTAALIKTCECNYVAGSTDDQSFQAQIASELDFWDQLTPDSDAWAQLIPQIHENPNIRKYVRRHYILSEDQFKEQKGPIKEGFVMERVDVELLKENTFENGEELLNWIRNWGDESQFNQYGGGSYIHNNKTIVSWSISDCSYQKSIAIGIHTDEEFRHKGFAQLVVSETIKGCFEKGYETVEWLCVDSNKGSIAIAEKLGFVKQNEYTSFTSYPPIENVTDLSKEQWNEWAQYLEHASKNKEELIWECLFSYIKADEVLKTIEIMKIMQEKQIEMDYSRINGFVEMLKEIGLCSSFEESLQNSISAL